jgi:hypothetical protein
MSEGMEPFVVAVRELIQREPESSVAARTASTAGNDRHTQVIVRQFDEVAARLDDMEQRRLAGSSRPSDDYYKIQLEKRMENLMQELDFKREVRRQSLHNFLCLRIAR